MKFDEIKKMPSKATVTSVEGRVKNIYTKQPTAAQERYKIHPQEVVLVDDEGQDLTVVIMKKDMHLPPGSQGRIAKFEAGENDRGHPQGLEVDVYKDVVKVNCGGFGSVRLLEGEPSPLPAAKQSAGSVRLVNIVDHEQTIVNLFNGIYTKIATGDGIACLDIAARLATTVYIEASKNGLIQPTLEGNPVPEVVKQMAEEANQPEPESGKPRKIPTLAEIVEKKLAGDDVDLEKLDRFVKKTGVTWEKVYDEFASQLSRVYPRKYIDQVYDEFNGIRLAHGSNQSEEDFLKMLFKDSDTFRSTVKDVFEAETEKQKQEEAAADDDIPF